MAAGGRRKPSAARRATAIVIEFGLHRPLYLLILHRGEEYKTILYRVLKYLPGVVQQSHACHIKTVIDHFAMRDELELVVGMTSFATGQEDQWMIANWHQELRNEFFYIAA